MEGENMLCPKCGTFQLQAMQCHKCGVVVAKFQRTPPQEATPADRAPGQEPTAAPAKTGGLIAFVIFCIVTGSAWVGFKLINNEASIDERMQDIAIYQMLKASDPVAYENFKRLIIKQVEMGATKKQIFARAQAFGAGLMKRYLPKASDAAVDNYAQEMRRVLHDARAQSPSLCYDLMYPERYSRVEVRQFMEAQIDTGYLDAIGGVIQSASQSPQPLPDVVRAAELLETALMPVAQRHGDDMLLFQKRSHSAAEKRKVCDMGTDIYEKILLMSQANASLALRYMMMQS